jgi:3-oxoadipate enol-lactonase
VVQYGMTSALAYDFTGPHGAPVLMLGSSMGTTRAMWQPQLEVLSRHHRVLRFDHLGHGESPVPHGPYRIDQLGRTVLRLLEELGIARVSYAGVSLGGMIGMWLATHHPTVVDRLALICTSAFLPPARDWLARAAAVRAGGTEAVAEAVVARWFTDDFQRRRPDTVDALRAAFEGISAEGYASSCEAIAAMDQRTAIRRITAPTLVISGADDPSTPPEHGATIAAAIPGARFEIVPDAAHLAGIEQATAVTKLLVAHFA